MMMMTNDGGYTAAAVGCSDDDYDGDNDDDGSSDDDGAAADCSGGGVANGRGSAATRLAKFL